MHHPHSWGRLRKHVSVREKVKNMSTSVCFYVKKGVFASNGARRCVCVSARRDLPQRRISELNWKSEILDFLFERLSIWALKCLFTSPMGLIQHVLPEFNHTNLHFSHSSVDVTDPWCHGSYHNGLHARLSSVFGLNWLVVHVWSCKQADRDSQCKAVSAFALTSSDRQNLWVYGSLSCSSSLYSLY